MEDGTSVSIRHDDLDLFYTAWNSWSVICCPAIIEEDFYTLFSFLCWGILSCSYDHIKEDMSSVLNWCQAVIQNYSVT